MNAQPPGLLPTQANPDVVMMICTAGHVDHGKTALVQCLTGCLTDSLKEEQERGMTIELGFAPCYLRNNLCVGIVDVPGHEKLVKTMVAGVSGIGLAMLVIAADDGIMPQTIEHLQILELLGVQRGLVALTKIDLVSEELQRQRVEEIRALTRNTFLREAPICPVSSRTFEGYGQLFDTLVAQITSAPAREQTGLFRMPIEEVFVLSGQGTILTGIPTSGSIQVGAQVELIPGGQTGRIRGIQRFLRDAAQGGSGQCLALNVPEFNKHPPVRGQLLCVPGCLEPAACLHVRLKLVPDLKKPLQNAEEIKLHCGTLEEYGKLYLLEGDDSGSRPQALATLVLNQPSPVAAWDHFILRRPSPPETVAGGVVLAITREAQRPRKAVMLPRLLAQEEFFRGVEIRSPGGLRRQVEWWLLRELRTGATARQLSCALLWPLEQVQTALETLVNEQQASLLAEDLFIHAEAYLQCRREVESRIAAAAQKDTSLSLTLADLKKDFNWPAPLWARIERELEAARQITRRGDKVLLSGAIARLGEEDRALLEQILATYETSGYHSPRPEELPDLLKAPMPRIQRLLDLLYHERKLVRLSALVVLSFAHYKKAQDLVVKVINEKGVLDSANFKGMLDTTRKYALAILDFMDARRITVRRDNDRHLLTGYEKSLLQ
jgi:selenocysteine-specific elongation factor